MYTLRRWVTIVVPLGILVLIGGMLLHAGAFGITLFCFLPALAGGLGAIIFDAKSRTKAATLGMLTTLVGCFSFVAVGLDGMLCVLMSLPLALPLGALGGVVAHQLTRTRAQTANLMLAAIPLVGGGSLGWDTLAKPPVRPVVTTIEIAATPQQVWQHVVEFPDLAAPAEWYFRAGLAYPKRARIVDGIRYCEFSTGPFVEPITTWDEPRLLAFDVTGNPQPMREWSPYEQIDPKHLHGYMESERGEFRLTPIAGGRATRLQGTTWYRHGLWPDTYWRLWSDAIIHRIHLRVLQHIKTLAEKEQKQ